MKFCRGYVVLSLCAVAILIKWLAESKTLTANNPKSKWIKRHRLEEPDIHDFPLSLSFSETNVIAWGKPAYVPKDAPNSYSYIGSVQTYDYHPQDGTMTPKGSRMFGEDVGGFFGSRTLLSADGRVLLVTCSIDDDRPRSYAQLREWNETQQDWDIHWDSRQDMYPQRNVYDAVLSKDGNHMVLSFGFKIQWSKTHVLQAYQRTDDGWVEYGQPLDQHFVESMDISTNGRVLAIGTTSLASVNGDTPNDDPASIRAYVLTGSEDDHDGDKANASWIECADPIVPSSMMDSSVALYGDPKQSSFAVVAGGMYRSGGALQVLQGSTNNGSTWNTMYDRQIRPRSDWIADTSLLAIQGTQVAFIEMVFTRVLHKSQLSVLDLETNETQIIKTDHLLRFQTSVQFSDGGNRLFLSMEDDMGKQPRSWVEVWERNDPQQRGGSAGSESNEQPKRASLRTGSGLSG